MSKNLHVERSGQIQLEGSPDQVFPLFGPVREAEWAAGWQIQICHATTPLLEEKGAVFTTRSHGDQQTIWVITEFDQQAKRVDYLRITPHLHAAEVSVQCHALEEYRTAAIVVYRLTGLTPEGNAHIEHDYNEAAYQKMLAHWQQEINRIIGS